MKARDFEELLKTKKPKDIISDYMANKIYLTELQLAKVCSLGEHHGGCNFKYRKKEEK